MFIKAFTTTLMLVTCGFNILLQSRLTRRSRLIWAIAQLGLAIAPESVTAIDNYRQTSLLASGVHAKVMAKIIDQFRNKKLISEIEYTKNSSF